MSLRSKKNLETKIENLSLGGEIWNFFTYCIFLVTYYCKEKVKGDFWIKFLSLSVLILLFFKWYYKRNEDDNDMIDGMAVPKRNGNYTLEID